MARILVAEDSSELQQLLCFVLAAEGHATHGVRTVAEGRRALETGDYELVVADMRLPDGSGAQLAEKARTHGVEALLTTGHPEEMQLMERRGIDHLRKPFRLRDFARLVNRRVARRHRLAPRSGFLCTRQVRDGAAKVPDKSALRS